MKKTLSTLKFAAILLLAGVMIACGKENLQRKEEFKMPEWSNAIGYISALQSLKCMDAQILVYDKDWHEWTSETFSLKGDIIGTWMLLMDCSKNDTIDYSCESIIYIFNANGIVTIKSNVKEIQSGQFEYAYYTDPFCPLCDVVNPLPNLVIGTNKSFCQVADTWLTTFAVNYVGENGINRGEMERIFCKIN
ncbi:MAG: hypothetical protein LBK94_01925 [Prevotellaceae bacterium]|jgi:hypothetical protein|nr:hypothetical protein [Prevotellaceae bacterium]